MLVFRRTYNMTEVASYRSFICLIFWAVNIGFVVGGKYPVDRPRCVPGDAECLKDVVNQYVHQSANGIPAIHLIPTDPLFVPEINIIQGSESPVNIKLHLKNISFYGFSSLDITRVHGFDKDPRKSKFEIDCMVPKLSILGHYKVGGKVIVLPVVGEGPVNLTFVNLNVVAKFDPRIDIKNGKEYLQFNKVNVDFNTTRLHMHFESLFNGDKLLGDTSNQFFNENWADILQELKPVLRDTIGGILQTVIGSVFAAFPYEYVFIQS